MGQIWALPHTPIPSPIDRSSHAPMEAALSRLEAVTQRLEAVAAAQAPQHAAPSRAYTPLAAQAQAQAAAAAAPPAPAPAPVPAATPAPGAGPGSAAWQDFMQMHFAPLADLTPGLGDEVRPGHAAPHGPHPAHRHKVCMHCVSPYASPSLSPHLPLPHGAPTNMHSHRHPSRR